MPGDVLTERVEALIGPTIEGMGFDVVRVAVSGGQKPVLQIMAEPADGREMTVDHCADISRAVSAVLDVEDPIPEAFTLEVSSPGLDRPLVKLRDYDRFAGFEAKVELQKLKDGRRKYRGRVMGTNENTVMIDVEGETIKLAFDEIGKAKLIITDEMLAKLEEENAS